MFRFAKIKRNLSKNYGGKQMQKSSKTVFLLRFEKTGGFRKKSCFITS